MDLFAPLLAAMFNASLEVSYLKKKKISKKHQKLWGTDPISQGKKLLRAGI